MLLAQLIDLGLDDALVQFLEQRFGLAQLLAGRELARRPTRLGRRRTIDERLVRSRRLLEGPDLETPREIPLVPQLSM